jgi:hypothetical protein
MIERREADIEAIIRDAADGDAGTVTIRRDPSGLTILAEVQRAYSPAA